MPRTPNPANFRTSWIFGIPKLRTLFEDFDPLWPLQPSYCLENVPILTLFVLGFIETSPKHWFVSVKVPLFMKTLFPPFVHLRLVSGRCLCVHPHSGGVVGFSIIGFSNMTPPDDGDNDGDDDDGETKFPRRSRPSPAPAPRNKMILFLR